MWTSALTAAALLALTAGECHKYEKEYYTEVGCKPEVLGDDGCPKSYDCSGISQRSQSKCYYQGQEYTEGHNLQQNNECLVGCRCAPSYPNNKVAFTCVSVECPELFIGPPPPDCYRTYEHGKCCHVDQVCGQTPEQKGAKSVCLHGGKEYQIGQKFYPDEDSCLQCICQPGFNGSLIEPFCKKINCNLELHYGRRIADGCVPVYYGENDCCPIGWRCPEKSDTVVPAASADNDSKTNSDLQCQFGEMKMKVGDKLSASGEWQETECECRVPPHPMCIKKYEEYIPPPPLPPSAVV